MLPFMAKVLHVRFFGVSVLLKLTNCELLDRFFMLNCVWKVGRMFHDGVFPALPGTTALS